MFDQSFITGAINKSAENRMDRRLFLRAAGVTGIGVAATALTTGAALSPQMWRDGDHEEEGGPSDSAILNFALNLEYLEAEFYLRAVTGEGLPDKLTHGRGDRGRVTGCRQVPFKSSNIRQFAREIASDEKSHVEFLRSALGRSAVARPDINLNSSFTAAAMAAGLIKKGETFDVYASETNFLLGAFIFEDVGVSAYKGAAPLIHNKTYLGAAAGILAVEAYHAAIIRTTLYGLGLQAPAGKISDARDSLDGRSDDDQGIEMDGTANLVPSDKNAIAFGRTPGRVLNIVYLTPKTAHSGGFFPRGVNGSIRTSGR